MVRVNKPVTATELAKKMKVSVSYVCRLCRLPASNSKHIKNMKIGGKVYVITDEKLLSKWGFR